MSNISLELIKTLRERTGAGMMDCKKALAESDGDIEVAFEAMRIKGQAKAATKAGRTAAEGKLSVKTKQNDQIAIMIEFNCETDFAAKNEDFLQFTNTVTEIAINQEIDNTEKLMDAAYDGEMSVEEARKNLVAKMGENVQVRRIAILKSNEKIACYVHNGKIGCLVKLEGADAALGKDIAMQIVANNPITIDPNDIPQELINKEKEIFSEQAKATGKPDNIIEKMVEGRINKLKEEISLLGQAFVKDPSVTIKQLLEKSNAKVLQFIRFEVGEGIEKTTENFADEVRKQAESATKS